MDNTNKNWIMNIFTILIVISISLQIAYANPFSGNNTSADSEFNPFSISSERFVTDQKGNILMHVNIWGHVKNPGSHLVYDGIDLATLLSSVGGPLAGAHLSKIRLIREQRDSDDKLVYEINIKEFYNKGDRSTFVKILPNDTIIIEEKLISKIFRRSNALTSILQIINIYLQIKS